MPKKVDHDQRRREIADAVARLAATNGLTGVSFREVAAEAGMSVANVQHYVATKHDLLVGALNRQSASIGARILKQLDALDGSIGPLDQIRVIATAFIPIDETSTAAMRVYHGFVGAAVTDQTLRSAEAFANGRVLIETLSEHLRAAVDAGDVRTSLDPNHDAVSLLALVLGLSLFVLLDQMAVDDATAALDHYLRSLAEHH